MVSFMKSYTKLLLFIVVLMAVVLPMMIKGPNGKPIMALNDWLPSDVDVSKSVIMVKSLGQSAKQAINSVVVEQEGSLNESSVSLPVAQSVEVVPLASGQMYKWRDKKGRWQFSNEAPTNLDSVEVADLPEIKNVMDAPISQRKNSSTIGLPDSLSLENAGELLERMGLSTD